MIVDVEEIIITGTETEIHAHGKVAVKANSCRTESSEYGIKTDRDESGEPDIKIKADAEIKGGKVDWYDWEKGVLTEEEKAEMLTVE